MPSGPVMKTCQPSFARVRPLAIATTTLNRIVVVVSSPLDACTMKVTATIFLRDADSPTLVDFFQREKRSTFIAPSMTKKAHVKEICWRVRRAVLSKRPIFCRECGLSNNKTIHACTSSDVKEAVPFILLL
jgi:hypothetical protein